MVTAERQICKVCDKSFGTDEAERCNTCHQYICPHCKQCGCFNPQKIIEAIGIPYSFNVAYH